jgi:hypothetical protein
MAESVFVSFYTDNWLYPEHAAALRESLERLGLQHDIRRVEGSDWLSNTRQKAAFIREMLDIYSQIVWLDVDSAIHQRPGMLLDFREDMLLRPHSTVPGRKWHVSVMGWKATRATRLLCNAWIKQCEQDGGTDEAAFDAVIGRYESKVSIGRMPDKYHILPGDADDHRVITIGLSKDEEKLRLKNTPGGIK